MTRKFVVSLSRAHGLTKAEAVAKMQNLTNDLNSKYGVKVNHSGDSTKVKGKGVDGTARCDDTKIHIDLKLGLPVSLVAGRVEAGINKALDQHF